MSLLKQAPRQAVGSVRDFLTVAQAMEREAAARYAALSQRARMQGLLEIADLFDRLSEEKRDHERRLSGWSRAPGEVAEEQAQLKWRLPPTFDDEAGSVLANSQLATPYRVLSMAVRNEERVFAFWTYVASDAGTPRVRQLAERIAHEELNHVAVLRQARRRAYHVMWGSVPRPRTRSVADRMAEAAILESHLADHLECLAHQLADDDAGAVRELAAQSREMADEATRHGSPVSDPGALDDPNPLATAERLAESYLDIADLSRSEHVVAAAQSLAQRAIARLERIRTLVSQASKERG